MADTGFWYITFLQKHVQTACFQIFLWLSAHKLTISSIHKYHLALCITKLHIVWKTGSYLGASGGHCSRCSWALGSRALRRGHPARQGALPLESWRGRWVREEMAAPTTWDWWHGPLPKVFCFPPACLSARLAQAGAELRASGEEPGRGRCTFPGEAVHSASSVASAPLWPNGGLKQRQKSSGLQAEPFFFVQTAIFNYVLKVKFIIWGKNLFGSCRNTILYLGIWNNYFGPPGNLLLVPVCETKWLFLAMPFG